jgi:hypothetical protein
MNPLKTQIGEHEMDIITTGGNVQGEPAQVGAIRDNEVIMMDPRVLHSVMLNMRANSPMSDIVDEALVNSILTKGYDPLRPLMGAWTEIAGGVQEVLILDGARRLRAVMTAIEKGADIKAVPVRIAPHILGNPDDHARAYLDINALSAPQ